MTSPDPPRSSALFLLAAVAALVSIASAEAAQDPTRNCFWQLAHGRGAEITCEHPTWLTDEERSDLRKLTRDYLQDLRCTVSVRIQRLLVDDAMELTEHIFDAPPQPVACELQLRDSVMPISATFAPRVVIKQGKAVDATPGLADVKGVNGYLAWPVIQYVNRAPGIRAEMLRMINAYIEQNRSRAVARR
jgi:hypothetical protein